MFGTAPSPFLDGSTDISTLPGLTDLWSDTVGDERIRIAILDGPVDHSHPCFQGAHLSSLPTLVADAAGDGRMSAHGTHIASMIFGQHAHGSIRGVAPGCSGLLVPIFSDTKKGRTSQLDLARAINQAVEAGAHVLNISGGELSNSDEVDPILANAVRNCNQEGRLIVSAAGNDACRCIHVPAALPSVLAVGASDANGLPLASSNWGDIYRSQGVLTLGERMLGAIPGGGVALRSGTSFATPVVSGIVALLLSLQLKQGNGPDARRVREAILASATPCDEKLINGCERFLAGSLNIPGAYAMISNGGYEMSSSSGSTEFSNEQSYVALSGQSCDRESSEGVLAAELSGPAVDEVVSSGVEQSEACDNVGSLGISQVHAAAPNETSFRSHGLLNQSIENASGSRSTSRRVGPSACGCQTNGTRSKVFAIGVLGYDFGTEARRDAFKQLMPNVTAEGIPTQAPDPPPFPPNPYDARQLVNYLGGFPAARPPFPTEGGFPRLENQGPAFPSSRVEPKEGAARFPAHLSEATELIWTLNIELTPIYAVRPNGNFASEVYQRLVASLAGQILDPEHEEYVERVSIGGVLTGESVRLYSGQVIPVLEPQVRGFYSWNTNILLEAALQATRCDLESEQGKSVADGVRQFLNRLYYDLRNLGQTSSERALNFTATNAFQAAQVFIQGYRAEKSTLDSITVERSAFCRMDSDCWDVKFIFFDPENERRSRRVFRYTVDVSDTYPVTVGPVREWDISSF